MRLRGQRLDPRTDGRWDPRPTVRERARGLADLRRDFNFKQPPRRPLVLPFGTANIPGPMALPEPFLPPLPPR